MFIIILGFLLELKINKIVGYLRFFVIAIFNVLHVFPKQLFIECC